MATDANKKIPIFLGHGDMDMVFYFRSIVQFNFANHELIEFCLKTVPYQVGKLSYDFIKSRGYPVTFKTYNYMGHHISPEEMRDVISFLQQVIPARDS
jgi:predicted esterase